MNVLLKKYSFSDDNCHEFRLGLAAVKSCFAKPRYIRLGKKVTLNMDPGNILYKRQEHSYISYIPCHFNKTTLLYFTSTFSTSTNLTISESILEKAS